MKNAEYNEQVAVVKYLDVAYPNALYSASCGGMRTSIGAAKKMKTSGYKKGLPDLMIFEPRGSYHGLFVEMKAPLIKSISQKGRTSPEQLEWQEKLNERGYMAIVCYGFEEAKKAIDGYLR
jgi:VRR-NUC domain.